MRQTFAKKIETLGQEQTWLKYALADANLEEGTFKGVASVFGSTVQSWMPTVIEPGAFTKTLQENSARIKLLWQHDPSEPIGKPSSLQETQQGLEITGKISKTTRGSDCLILMRDGVIDELSIGFDPIKWEMEDKGNGEVLRHIKEVRLWEISAVTFAADPLAKIQAIHCLQPILGFSFEDFSSALREVHEGKVLSKKNKQLLEDALAAITALIATAEPPADEPAQGTTKQALTVNAERLNRLRDAELALAQSLNS
jgi:uncharacterized protein